MDAINIFLACDSSPCYHVLCDRQPVSPPPKSSQDPTDCHSGNPPVLLPGICRLVGGIPVKETELRNSDFDTSSYNYIHGHIYSTHFDLFSHSNGYHDSDHNLNPHHYIHSDKHIHAYSHANRNSYIRSNVYSYVYSSVHRNTY
jgi:hypothetical protein